MKHTILVHGRAALNRPISRENADGDVDLSTLTYILEIPALKLRRVMPSHPVNPSDKLLQLSRVEVAQLPLTATPFVIIDETNPLIPIVATSGLLCRVGDSNVPN